MAATYKDRLLQAEGFVARARTKRERDAFEEIATIWRRLAAAELDGGDRHRRDGA